MEILSDVLVKVDTFIFLVYFVILNCEVDFEVPKGELKFRLNKDKVKFNIYRSMNQLNDMSLVSAIEVIVDKYMTVTIEDRMSVETLAAMLMNFDANFLSNYLKTVNAFYGIRSHSYTPNKLDLYLKNTLRPQSKPSIEEPPVLELKQLPRHIRYGFLGTNNTLHVILDVDLDDEKVQEVIKVLKR